MLNQTFNELKLEKHPDKTSIGRIEKGFDYLGYHFKQDELSVSETSIARFKERIARLMSEVPLLSALGNMF